MPDRIHFLGPAWQPDGTPILVEQPGRGYGGWPRQRHRQRTRMVVDDYGNAVCFQRRCVGCLRWLALSFNHFAGGERMQRQCNVCAAAANRLRNRRNPGEMARRQRERRAAMAPEQRARHQESNRRAREQRAARDPEREKALERGRQKRYYDRVRNDPGRWQAKLEKQRIDYRLRREREGRQLAEPQTLSNSDRLPIGPFRDVVIAEAYRRVLADPPPMSTQGGAAGIERAVADLLGTDDRRLYAWRYTNTSIPAAFAERAWNALGLNWLDVYGPGAEGYESAARIWGDAEADAA